MIKINILIIYIVTFLFFSSQVNQVGINGGINSLNILNLEKNLNLYENKPNFGYSFGLNYDFCIDSTNLFLIKLTYSSLNSFLYIKSGSKYSNYFPIKYQFSTINLSGSYLISIVKSKKLSVIIGATIVDNFKIRSINLETNSVSENTKDFQGVFMGLNLGLSLTLIQNRTLNVRVQNENILYPYLKGNQLMFIPSLSVLFSRKIKSK
jgi:hypothetical protein